MEGEHIVPLFQRRKLQTTLSSSPHVRGQGAGAARSLMWKCLVLSVEDKSN